MPGLNRDRAYSQRLPAPTVDEQRAIADFLDVETARIDALITKKRHLIELLTEGLWAYFESLVSSTDRDRAPLRRALLTITDGPFGSSLKSSHYVDEGARVVRLGNIGFAEFRDSDKAYISREYFGTLEKHVVRPGDLLIAGLGDSKNHVGRSCVAPEDLGEAIVKADCYCAAVDSRVADAEFLALFLSSPSGSVSVARSSRGTTRSRINLDIAKSVLVPLPSLRDQQRIRAKFTDRQRVTSSVVDAIGRQIELLSEKRQALITSAVTGELKVA